MLRINGAGSRWKGKRFESTCLSYDIGEQRGGGATHRYSSLIEASSPVRKGRRKKDQIVRILKYLMREKRCAEN